MIADCIVCLTKQLVLKAALALLMVDEALAVCRNESELPDRINCASVDVEASKYAEKERRMLIRAMHRDMQLDVQYTAATTTCTCRPTQSGRSWTFS